MYLKVLSLTQSNIEPLMVNFDLHLNLNDFNMHKNF